MDEQILINELFSIVRRAIVERIPVDIYFRIANHDQSESCFLKYSNFLITEINGTIFSGYTNEMQQMPSDQRVLTPDNIGLIYNIRLLLHLQWINLKKQ